MAEELLDLAGIAELLQVAPDTARQWRKRGRLPEPDYVVSGSPAWRRRTIIRWAKARLEEEPRARMTVPAE